MRTPIESDSVFDTVHQVRHHLVTRPRLPGMRQYIALYVGQRYSSLI